MSLALHLPSKQTMSHYSGWKMPRNPPDQKWVPERRQIRIVSSVGAIRRHCVCQIWWDTSKATKRGPLSVKVEIINTAPWLHCTSRSEKNNSQWDLTIHLAWNHCGCEKCVKGFPTCALGWMDFRCIKDIFLKFISIFEYINKQLNKYQLSSWVLFVSYFVNSVMEFELINAQFL